MRKSSLKHILAVLLVVALATGITVAVPPSGSSGDGGKGSIRASGHRNTGGFDPLEQDRVQRELGRWLAAETPDGLLAAPIRIDLTGRDRDRLARGSGDGRLLVGLTKPVARSVDLSGLKLFPGLTQFLPTGAVRPTDDGGFVWSVALTSEGAAALRVKFRGVSLPGSSELFVYSPEGKGHGPYAGRGPNETGEFWSHTVTGSTVVVQVRHHGPVTAEDLRATRFQIVEIGHVARMFGPGVTEAPGGYCGNESCIEGATCHNTTFGGDDISDAAGYMEWIAGAFIYACSGGLIADTDPNTDIPYFLTANHCLKNNKNAGNLEVFWHFTDSCMSPSCGGPSGPSNMGATVKATGGQGDFTLLELNQPPPSSTVSLGWNNTTIAFTDGVDLYRVSHPNCAPQTFSHHQVDTSAGTCGGWPRGNRIYSMDVLGSTDLGSSGSPIVNSNGEIVGQLTGSCGSNVNDVCDAAANATVDGALAYYYDNVAEFLDPTGCTPSPEVCNNGSDDDCDGDVDCDDADCTGDPACPGEGCVNPGGAPKGASCSSNGECCSNKCKGPAGNKSCK